MREGLSLLKSLGTKGRMLVGDPGYYQRFGSKSLPGLAIDGVPPQYFLTLAFEENKPHGTVVFHEGFTANS
jgi:putative acetyltransferase